MTEVDIRECDWGKYTKSVIFGKGPTFQIIPKEELVDVFVACVNDTINYIDKCDILVCNDIETFDKIRLERLTICKYILVPYHIHKRCRPHLDFTYTNLIEKIKKYYSSKLIIYNLKTVKKIYKEMCTLDSARNSSVTAYEFISKYIPRIHSHTFYGVCRLNDSSDASTMLFYNKREIIVNNQHIQAYKIVKQLLDNISRIYKNTYVLM
jgi:hypothetical protein